MKRSNKLLYLILGIGIGVIVSSTLYSIFPNVKYIELSDDIIMDKARELGMINLKESINLDISSKEENQIKKEVVPEKVLENEEYVIIEIEKGDTLEDVANKLFSSGLIDNKEEFILLAEDKTLDKKFNYGKFKLKYNTSYSTIIKILTE